jgi:hypothetical protein
MKFFNTYVEFMRSLRRTSYSLLSLMFFKSLYFLSSLRLTIEPTTERRIQKDDTNGTPM